MKIKLAVGDSEYEWDASSEAEIADAQREVFRIMGNLYRDAARAKHEEKRKPKQ